MSQDTKVSELPIANVTTANDRVVILSYANSATPELATYPLENITNLTLNTPANSTINTSVGSISFDSSYLYVSIANNVIRRIPLQSF